MSHLDKHPLKTPHVKVSSLVVTSFNGMSMSEIRYKRQENLGTEKTLKCKIRELSF